MLVLSLYTVPSGLNLLWVVDWELVYNVLEGLTTDWIVS